MEYVVAMKSGAMFMVTIKDFNAFIVQLQETVSKGVASPNHYYAEGGFMFCIEDISAVYPKSAQQNLDSNKE
jgi:hypothetical protein